MLRKKYYSGIQVHDIVSTCIDNYEQIMALLSAFAEAPVADVVEVVRCKNCKYRDNNTQLCTGRGWPMQLVPDDGFCEKGAQHH